MEAQSEPRELPLNYPDAREFLREYESRLATGRLVVPADQAPPAGGKLALKVGLPHDEQVLEVPATVVTVDEHGAQLRVLWNDQPEAQGLLADRAALCRSLVHPPAESRGEPPAVVEKDPEDGDRPLVRVTFRDAAAFLAEYRYGLRRGGLILRTERPPIASQDVKLVLHVPSLGSPVELAAIVAIVRPEWFGVRLEPPDPPRLQFLLGAVRRCAAIARDFGHEIDEASLELAEITPADQVREEVTGRSYGTGWWGLAGGGEVTAVVKTDRTPIEAVLGRTPSKTLGFGEEPPPEEPDRGWLASHWDGAQREDLSVVEAEPLEHDPFAPLPTMRAPSPAPTPGPIPPPTSPAPTPVKGKTVVWQPRRPTQPTVRTKAPPSALRADNPWGAEPSTGATARTQAAPRPASASQPAPASASTFDGSLAEVPAAALFQELWRGGFSGALHIEAGERSGTLQLQQGLIVHLEMPAHPAPKIGALLVEAGYLDVEQFEQALMESTKSGERLGAVLVERGLVSQQIIEQAVAHQLTERVDLLTGLEQGTFRFEEGAPPGPDAIDPGLNPCVLVLSFLVERYMRRTLIEMRLADNPYQACRVVVRPGAPEIVAELELAEAEENFWKLLMDGQQQVPEVYGRSGLAPRFAHAFVHALHKTGLVDLER